MENISAETPRVEVCRSGVDSVRFRVSVGSSYTSGAVAIPDTVLKAEKEEDERADAERKKRLEKIRALPDRAPKL